jgi:hypothetical protein
MIAAVNSSTTDVNCSATEILSSLVQLLPPTAGGGKSNKKRKKVSPQQALKHLIQQEQVGLGNLEAV